MNFSPPFFYKETLNTAGNKAIKRVGRVAL